MMVFLLELRQHQYKELYQHCHLILNVFDTGMIAPNIVNVSIFGNKKCVHVYVPSFVTKILHMYDVKFRDGEPQTVRYPHMLFSFCSAGTSNLTGEINLLVVRIFTLMRRYINLVTTIILIAMVFVGARIVEL